MQEEIEELGERIDGLQFCDMLHPLDAGRLKEFHFTVEDRRDDGHWPLRS